MIDSNLNITKYANKQDKDTAMGFLSNVDWGAAKYLAKKIQKDQLKEDEKIIFLIDRKAQLIGFSSLLIVDIISKRNPKIRPGLSMKSTYITDHDTGNPGRGANAEMHNRYHIKCELWTILKYCICGANL